MQDSILMNKKRPIIPLLTIHYLTLHLDMLGNGVEIHQQ